MRVAKACRLVLWLPLLVACREPAAIDHGGPTAEWPQWGGDLGGGKWSPLVQITRDNVESLEVAWTYRHGDISDGTGEATRSSFNATPIVTHDTLYFCTGMNRVIALDPESGAERWSFDEVNDLIERHNRWYPAESKLPMDPRRGDFVLVNGRDYRRRPLDAEWILARHPVVSDAGAAAA